eukprot:m.19019 g.19019  ORF g.19019 m.19019 type:complete len:148 (-) comp30622_c0_seq1:193-636(-)
MDWMQLQEAEGDKSLSSLPLDSEREISAMSFSTTRPHPSVDQPWPGIAVPEDAAGLQALCDELVVLDAMIRNNDKFIHWLQSKLENLAPTPSIQGAQTFTSQESRETSEHSRSAKQREFEAMHAKWLDAEATLNARRHQLRAATVSE